MAENLRQQQVESKSTRRNFLEQMGRSAVVGGVVSTLLDNRRLASAAEPATSPAGVPAAGVPAGKVRHRRLGKTGLSVSEIGIGGHSWSYATMLSDGKVRMVSPQEAEEMIRLALDMGVNFIDADTRKEEHTVPGNVLKTLKKRDQMVISARLCHKMKGVKADQDEIYKFLDERLPMWHTDYIDLLMLSNAEYATERSGYWDMEYSIEALDKAKKQGKIRYAGFGSHFTPDLFLEAIEKYGKHYDVISMPYNVRHCAAEEVMPAAEKIGLGTVTIKPFAKGAVFAKLDLKSAYPGLPRDMLAFILDNPLVDVCIPGMHSVPQLKENFSASWTGLSAEARKRLKSFENPLAGLLGAADPRNGLSWLEKGWRLA